MSIFKAIYSSVYGSLVKNGYNIFHRNEGKETIYWKIGNSAFTRKYLIVVEDIEIGKRLYDVLATLKKSKFYISQAVIEFIKFGVSRKNVIKWFIIEFEPINWEDYSKLEKLQSLQLFVEAMSQKSLILDDTRVDFECNSLSEFLAFFSFSESEEKVKRAEGLVIEYIHHILSNGRNLKELYESISKKTFFTESDVPYHLPVALMCYRYASSGFIPQNVYNILRLEENASAEFGENSWIVVLEDFESTYEATEKTSEYTVYGGSYKIYNDIPYEFTKFLKSSNNIFEKQNNALEKMEAVLVNLDGKVIGYKLSRNNNHKNCYSLSNNGETPFKEYKPTSQVSLVLEIEKVVRFLRDNSADEETYEAVDISKILVLIDNKVKAKTIEDLYDITNNDFEISKQQTLELFFELLAKYMVGYYGSLFTKEQFYEKNEVRYMPPLVAREFVKYTLKHKISYSEDLEDEFFRFIYDKEYINLGENIYYIDKNLCCDEVDKDFLFDYEVAKKYGLNVGVETETKLPDGRILTILENPTRLDNFSDRIQKNRRKFGHIECNSKGSIKLINVSKVIFRRNRLNGDNMYQVIGYITKPISGRKLTNDVFLNLNNKNILKVLAYLYCSSEICVHHSNYWMDENFTFYLDFMKDGLELKNMDLRWIIDSIINDGYPYYAFAVLEPCSISSNMNRREFLLNIANNLDAYCDEHQIYYNSKDGECPVCFKTKFLIPSDYKQRYRKVLEDDVAIHYNIDAMYNLKIYKNEYNKLLEERVKNAVNNIIKGKNPVNYFYQECLVPLKLALDDDQKFIGYLYAAVEFEEPNNDYAFECQDIADVNKLSNLPRVKSLIRLATQVKEILKNKVGFTNNPFSYVFLNTSVKRQVQILNVEFLTENSDWNILNQTRKWTYEYISKVISLDSTITLYSSKLPEYLDDIIEELNKVAAFMTNYCEIHNTWYNGIEYICCPKCVAPENYPKNIKKITSLDISSKPINEGGEAFIYSMPNNTVLKVFKNDGEVDKNFKGSVLCKILTKKEILDKINEENHKFKYVIPKDIYVLWIEKEIVGYTMEHIQNANPISILRDKVEVQKLGLSREDIFEILITIGEGIETLHKQTGIFIGDLNGRNILFDKDKNVYFLDFDGMGIDEIKPEFCTDGYIDPVSKNNQSITMKDDWYSYAIQAFYYLTYTHPFNGVYYERINGKRYVLEIPEKMERRISLLGNHNMKAPDIAVPWDWMNADLKKAFLNIFEGESRVSIVPQLKEQYQILFPKTNPAEETILQESEQPLEKVLRVNPKFIAKELKVSEEKEIKVFKPKVGLCGETNSTYISFLNQNNEEVKIDLKALDSALEYEKISDVLLSNEYVKFVVETSKANYNIIFDVTTRLWLVLNNYGDGSIIKPTGEHQKIYLGKYIDDVNLENIYFRRNKIYIPGENVLYIAIVGDANHIVKTMECNKIMTPKSKIYEITSTGFKVVTNNVFYEVSKG